MSTGPDVVDLVPTQTFAGPRRWATPWTELSALMVGIVCSIPFVSSDVMAIGAAVVGFGITLAVHPGRRDHSITVGADGFEHDGRFVPWSRVTDVERDEEHVVVTTDRRPLRLRAHDLGGLRRAMQDARARHATPVAPTSSGDYRTSQKKSKAVLVRIVTSADDLTRRERAFAELDADTREELLSALADSRTREHLQS